MAGFRSGFRLVNAFLTPGVGARTLQYQSVRYLETGPKGTYIAKKIPAYVTLQAGKTYAWCLCGLSKKQPFCDGAHKTTEFKPVRFKLDETKKAFLCQCKQTSNRPYCDMTHVSVMMNSFKNKIIGNKK
ncbi:uncharacterized protein [Amphiura filiformis]|uniref:uncharacterized protein n=1 Tax=Amphiura filiformis TaxID=82378 RepID=UPI003B21B52F